MTDQDGATYIHTRRRLAFYSLGFLRPALRARLSSLGITLVPFGVGAHDGVIVWGRRKSSRRAIAHAAKNALPVITVEDAFLRSVRPGWQDNPVGLTLDEIGVHYSKQSKLVSLLGGELTYDGPSVTRQIDRLRTGGISKYNGSPRGGWVHRDYVLIIDQVRGDASIIHGGIEERTFTQMLADAKNAHPSKVILIRTHPAGRGHFDLTEVNERVIVSTEPANIWDVLEGAAAVYVGTSQVGFEAIMAGHRPIVYGHPFYAGWGLSDDRLPIKRGKLTREALFYGAMIAFPRWFDAAGRVADFDTAVDGLEARIRARDLARNYEFIGFKPWKRSFIRHFFPKGKTGQVLRWGERAAPSDWVVEDGFLRSRGLGAALVSPLSLVVDRTGIYFDPTQPSDLEAFIRARRSMTPRQKHRASKLTEAIVKSGVSKYNLAGVSPELPKGREIILVPGQVEDDRSIRLGATGQVKANADLLRAVRLAHPTAFIIYKPHPDVEAGLRIGMIDANDADLVYRDGGIDALWPNIDRVATITSLTGFEALIRNKVVECYGMPFYADWGLTIDHAPTTGRRGQANLSALIYATLIDYPLYYDPIARAPSTPEIIIDRLASGNIQPSWYLRAASWFQTRFYKLRARFRQ